MPNKDELIDVSSDYLQGIMFDYRQAFHSNSYDACSKCLMAAQQLARTFKETALSERLNEIRDGEKKGISVPYLEYFILKSIKRPTRGYKVRINDIDYSLGNLNDLLLKAKEETYLIFGEILNKYHLQPRVDWAAAITKDAHVSFDDLNV